MSNCFCCGKAAGDYTLFMGNLYYRSLSCFFFTLLAGIAVVHMLYNYSLCWNEFERAYYFLAYLFHRLTTVGAFCILYPVLHYLCGNTLRQLVQGILMPLPAGVRLNYSNIGLSFCIDFGLVKKQAQLF